MDTAEQVRGVSRAELTARFGAELAGWIISQTRYGGYGLWAAADEANGPEAAAVEVADTGLFCEHYTLTHDTGRKFRVAVFFGD